MAKIEEKRLDNPHNKIFTPPIGNKLDKNRSQSLQKVRQLKIVSLKDSGSNQYDDKIGFFQGLYSNKNKEYGFNDYINALE